MGSLVMLVPFVNTNLFSNTAMAQGYDKYRDSYYSTYQTDDKKYECRTGPFEGFFVSSVEFCKFNKFDDNDRKDLSRENNQTGTQGQIGPQGPPGPPGPQGIQGIQGERGFNGTQGIQGIQGERGFNGTQGIQGIQGERGFNGTQGIQGIQGERGFNGTQGPTQILPGTLYEVFGPSITSGDAWNSFAQSIAQCDEGDIVFNGESVVGAQTSSSVLTGIFSYELPGSNHREWIVLVQGIRIDGFANAICFDNPPLRP